MQSFEDFKTNDNDGDKIILEFIGDYPLVLDSTWHQKTDDLLTASVFLGCDPEHATQLNEGPINTRSKALVDKLLKHFASEKESEYYDDRACSRSVCDYWYGVLANLKLIVPKSRRR